MIKRPVLKFEFSNEENAKKFREYAEGHYASTRVQHPQVNTIPNLRVVLVSGTGSLNYDMNLKSDLNKVYERLES